MKSMQGMNALVTGATHGIGAAIARGFAEQGAKVIVHGRHAADGEGLASEIGGHFVRADLRDSSGVDSLCEFVLATFPHIDVIVNNAGMEVGSPVASIEGGVLLKTMYVNFHAPVLIVTGLLPRLASLGGGASVINVASIHSHVPAYGNTAYSASKAALHMFTKTAAIELAEFGVRVNTLSPGAIRTDHNQALIREIGESNFREWIPAGRVGDANELVGAAVFLATSASSYVTGTELVVDGGYSQHLVRYRSTEHSSN